MSSSRSRGLKWGANHISSFTVAVAMGAFLAGAFAAGSAPAIAASPQSSAYASNPGSSHFPRLRLRIAIAQFAWDNTNGQVYALPNDVRANIQEALIKKLTDSGYFQVMDREAAVVTQANEEAQIDQAKRQGELDPSGVKIPERQKTTAAAFIITPKVTSFQETNGGTGGTRVGIFQFGSRSTKLTMSMNIRISDAQTSEVIDSEDAHSEMITKDEGFRIDAGLVDYGQRSSTQTPIGKVIDGAMDDAVKKIIARLSREPWSALVATTDTATNRVVINAGTDAGVSEGLIFDVLRTTGAVRDPGTGEILSKGDEVKVGRIRVARVQNKVAFCDVVDGQDFKPLDIVRPVN